MLGENMLFVNLFFSEVVTMKIRTHKFNDRKTMNLSIPLGLAERLEELRHRDYMTTLSAAALRALAVGVTQMEKEPSIFEATGEQRD